jgi:hypothetical protein
LQLGLPVVEATCPAHTHQSGKSWLCQEPSHLLRRGELVIMCQVGMIPRAAGCIAARDCQQACSHRAPHQQLQFLSRRPTARQSPGETRCMSRGRSRGSSKMRIARVAAHFLEARGRARAIARTRRHCTRSNCNYQLHTSMLPPSDLSHASTKKQ